MKRFAAAAVVLMFSAPAFAQTQQEQVIFEEDRTVYRENTVIDGTGHVITADTTRPSGVVVFSKPKITFKSMIEVRGNFTNELAGSVDNL